MAYAYIYICIYIYRFVQRKSGSQSAFLTVNLEPNRKSGGHPTGSRFTVRFRNVEAMTRAEIVSARWEKKGVTFRVAFPALWKPLVSYKAPYTWRRLAVVYISRLGKESKQNHVCCCCYCVKWRPGV
jgi:hypothetical protein